MIAFAASDEPKAQPNDTVSAHGSTHDADWQTLEESLKAREVDFSCVILGSGQGGGGVARKRLRELHEAVSTAPGSMSIVSVLSLRRCLLVRRALFLSTCLQTARSFSKHSPKTQVRPDRLSLISRRFNC